MVMLTIKGRKTLLVSEARARFSELVQQVMNRPGVAVFIGRRDRKGSAVLIDALHYELLLEKAKIADNPPGEPFRLAGSIIPLISADEQEARMAERRKRQAELAAAKLADLR
jgi:prevent-host-death family protein